MTELEAAACFSNHPWKYHVFLSFRGEDTRNNFTGHLCSALRQKGITTFMDDELTRGEDISTALLQAIEESRVSIIVFSENYASSKWCLEELVKILECKESKQQLVRPVFYKVDPSDIRNQRGSFGQAFANLAQRFKHNLEKVQNWKSALSKAANLSGWPLSIEHSETKLIHDIVEEISEQVIKHTYLNVAKYPVGMEPRVRAINKLLGVQGRDVCMVGIWGTGGIGKTTIAKAVYNSIAHKFEGSCFLECVRENSASYGGLVKLQETLLFEILGRKELKVTNAAIGITTIKERFRYKSVLLVLDDVNSLNQLNNLAGGLDWFGKGSRIIITTRDKGLLVAHDIDLMYNVNKLDYHEAVELFSCNAFKSKGPHPEVYGELTERAIGYAQGLPLALTVLGSYLYGRKLDRWKASLDGFRSPEIQDILKISYDALVNSVKDVFLDIACFFKGGDRKYVTEMLDGCGLNPDNGINVLIEMALISIDEHDCIRMHDLLEEMGKDIVHQESPNDPGKRSRLWFHDDVYNVLTENTGTTKIIGIKVELPEESDEICLSSTTFSKMRNLRLFIHRAGCFSGVLDYLPNSLRVVDWPGCPFQSLPSSFNPRKLAILKLPRSRITRLVKGFKNLTNMTSINLSSSNLTRVSDLSEMPNLQMLDLSHCQSLVEVHSSVGFLDKLLTLNLYVCSSLISMPTIVSWISMGELQLEHCTSLENFVEVFHNVDCLPTLSLMGTGIKVVPSSIGYLTSLRKLDMSDTLIEELPSCIGNLIELEELILYRCDKLRNVPQSIYGLQHLLFLNLSGCKNLVVFPTKASSQFPAVAESLPLVFPGSSDYGSLQLFPRLTNLLFEGCNLLSIYDFLASLDCLSTLERLHLPGSNFVSLPICVSEFVGLHHLNLHCCKNLREISELPPCLEVIDVGGCLSLEKLPTLFRILESNDTQFLNLMDLSSCHMLQDAVEANEVVSKMAKALLLNQVHKKSEFEIILPGSEVPKWFDCREDEDSELSIEFPRNLKWKKIGFVVCAVLELMDTSLMEGEDSSADQNTFGLHVTVNETYSFWHYFEATVTEPSTHVWLKYIPLNVDIQKEVDAESDQGTPYSFELSLLNLSGQEFFFRSSGVHLASVPYDHDKDEGDEDDLSSEDSTEKRHRKRNVSISELGSSCDIDKAEAATLSTSSSLSGGISTKRGVVEHCDHDEEPGPTKGFEQITHGAEHNTSGSALARLMDEFCRSSSCCAVM